MEGVFDGRGGVINQINDKKKFYKLLQNKAKMKKLIHHIELMSLKT